LFYEYLPLLPFQVLTFTKSVWCDCIANDEWPPIHTRPPIHIHPMDHHVLRAVVAQLAVPESKNNSRVRRTATDLVCLSADSH